MIVILIMKLFLRIMNKKISIKCLPKTFHREGKILLSNNINNWECLFSLSDKKINELIHRNLGSVRNLKRLRCIAYFICTLEIELSEAAILMHSGMISSDAISRLTPQELVQRTGRFERILNTGRIPVIDLKKAHFLIEKAKKVTV